MFHLCGANADATARCSVRFGVRFSVVYWAVMLLEVANFGGVEP